MFDLEITTPARIMSFVDDYSKDKICILTANINTLVKSRLTTIVTPAQLTIISSKFEVPRMEITTEAQYRPLKNVVCFINAAYLLQMITAKIKDKQLRKELSLHIL